MNYRHAFHAGNHADVFKHVVLLTCLVELLKKPGPLAVLDTHAGRGRYDLASEAASRSPEWRDGAAKLWDWTEAPPALQPYRQALHACNPEGALRFLPGSPLLAACVLRPQDRLAACELHPEEVEALRRAAPRGAQIHARDGFTACRALLPPGVPRGLVLLDPPFEREDEWARSVAALAGGWRRFRHGVFVWWRPLKEPAVVDAADAELSQALPQAQGLRLDLSVRPPDAPGLGASSLLVLNPPFGARAPLLEALSALAARLGQPGAEGPRVRPIGPP
jgi:23S rRNA (adenine2030-N6)-methyltransferase